jgi:hypothetical protein
LEVFLSLFLKKLEVKKNTNRLQTSDFKVQTRSQKQTDSFHSKTTVTVTTPVLVFCNTKKYVMESSEEKVVAVIMVGGPTKGINSVFPYQFSFFFFIINFGFLFDFFVVAGTRFRPLSFNTPKPLFPLAGQPMVHHPISACKRVSFFFFFFFLNF